MIIELFSPEVNPLQLSGVTPQGGTPRVVSSKDRITMIKEVYIEAESMMVCLPFKATERAIPTGRIMVSLTVVVAIILEMVVSKDDLALIGIGANLTKTFVIMIKIFLQTLLQLEELEGAMALVDREVLEHVGVHLQVQD